MTDRKQGGSLWFWLLVIVSVAFILAHFSKVSAQDWDRLSLPGKSMTAAPITVEQPTRPSFNMGDSSVVMPLLKLFGALVLVVGAIYGSLYILRRMMGSRLAGNRGQKIIEVLEISHLTPKKAVSLVRFGERAVLVGMAENSLSVLAELDAAETGKIMDEIAKTTSENVGFKNLFSAAKDKLDLAGMKKIKAALLVRQAQ